MLEEHSPFSKHILEYWQRRNQDNILILMYEDMKKDLASAVRDIASFLEKNLNDDQVQQVVKHCSLIRIKFVYTYLNNSFSLNSGKVGDWRNIFTEEMSQQMDDYVQRHFEGTGLKFKFDL
uniref:Sulfotransferase domain-containing protein n=1 Tax=Strigamia maritima TaxID=126957 RepID=T1JAZ5_STRMM